MSGWLGVEDDYDAKKSGRGIGSWDNFEDDDDGWKRVAPRLPMELPAEDMLAAVASMGDDELLGHDIWFVATGAFRLRRRRHEGVPGRASRQAPRRVLYQP